MSSISSGRVPSGLLLNPRLSASLATASKEAFDQFSTPGQTWIATSGTTPTSAQQMNWILLSREAFESSAQAVNRWISASSKDVWLLSLPVFHVGGLGILYRALLSGSRVIQVSSSWDPIGWVHTAISDGATLTSLVPTQVHDLVARRLKAPRCLRAIFVGGAALSPQLYLQAKALGWPLIPSYGMTEAASMIAAANPLLNQDRYPDLELLGHVQVTSNDEGLLHIRGPSLLSGRVLVSSGQSATLQTVLPGSVWTTQDVGEVHGQLLLLTGREGDRIKIAGEGVSVSQAQFEVDSILRELYSEGVFQGEAVIVDVPDTRLGRRLELCLCGQFVSLEEMEAVGKIVLEGLRQRMLPIAVPSGVVRVSAVPRTELGKIKVSELRALVLQGAKKN